MFDYWPAPPPWEWVADDLDRLPADGPNGESDFFRHVELIDGALVVNAYGDRRRGAGSKGPQICSVTCQRRAAVPVS